MAQVIDVPSAPARPVTSEQRLANIGKICARALYACTGAFEPLTDIELNGYVQQIKGELAAISEDPRLKG